MQPWAQRIRDLLDSDPAKSQIGLATACGVAGPSVSQWFRDTDSKPSAQMIKGDNLVAAAAYLNTSAEFIMTGRSAASQPMGLDPAMLAESIAALRQIAKPRGWKYDPATHPDVTVYAYTLRSAISPDAVTPAVMIDFGEKVAERLRISMEGAGGSRDGGKTGRPDRKRA